MVSRSKRGGVPVLRRATSKPQARNDSESMFDGFSPTRPAGWLFMPTCTRPRRKVPVVMTTAPAVYSLPWAVRSPRIAPPSTMSSSASSLAMVRLSCASSTRRISVLYWCLSACARLPCTAGPFDALSMRNWIPVRSMTRAICPPRASISYTMWPLATPPMAGLHGIRAILSRSSVNSSVAHPIRADASAASHPACPAPITMTSYFFMVF